MNTKQILLNALQSQLSVKKQEYELYNNTVTKPAIEELNSEIKSFMKSIIINDDYKIEITPSKITISVGNDWYSIVELQLQKNYRNEDKWINITWNSGVYNLIDRVNNKHTINIISLCINNIKLIETKWINDWFNRRDEVDKNDSVKHKEFKDLQDALDNLKNEIKNDFASIMREIGFELKKFKQQTDLDFKFDENNKRIYKITNPDKTIKLQIGRSKYDYIYVAGFKVLDKKGNKYKIETFKNEQPDKIYSILEKKFDEFIDTVSYWEYEQADKQRLEIEKKYNNINQK